MNKWLSSSPWSQAITLPSAQVTSLAIGHWLSGCFDTCRSLAGAGRVESLYGLVGKFAGNFMGKSIVFSSFFLKTKMHCFWLGWWSPMGHIFFQLFSYCFRLWTDASKYRRALNTCRYWLTGLGYSQTPSATSATWGPRVGGMRWSFLRRWWDWGGGDELGLGIAMDWSLV